MQFNTIIKICGITRPEDGICALEAGTDWLGFIRAPRSPRCQPIEACTDLLMELRMRAPRPFQAVAVYVDADKATIHDEVRQAGFDRVQLHGNESPAFVRAMPVPAIKALRIRGAESLAEVEAFEGVDLLADAWHPTLEGGTGESWDYGLLADLVKQRRVLVAGGLTIENVGQVVRELRPWGVDVSSRLETAPGIKDHDLVRAFCAAVKQEQA